MCESGRPISLPHEVGGGWGEWVYGDHPSPRTGEEAVCLFLATPLTRSTAHKAQSTLRTYFRELHGDKDPVAVT